MDSRVAAGTPPLPGMGSVGKDDSNGLVVGGWVRSHWEWRRPAAFAKRGYVGYYYSMEHETAASE